MSRGGPGVQRSQASRHVVVRLGAGETLPESLLGKLRDEGVTSGWIRASGVLADVELRTFDARLGGPGPARVVEGSVQALVVEGALGPTGGVVGCTLRTLLAREGEAGHEVLGGEIQSARTIALEVLVTCFDDVSLARAFDPAAGVWLVAAESGGGAGRPGTELPQGRTWSGAVSASDDVSTARGAPGGGTGGARMPQKLARQAVDLDSPAPDTGDVVEHFAFGVCEVMKSDGDRLHLRMQRDGRIKEISLDMLRVTLLGDEPPRGDGVDATPRRRFKLDRKM
jgi:predicted DNA-binding protein with PD1-like motif